MFQMISTLKDNVQLRMSVKRAWVLCLHVEDYAGHPNVLWHNAFHTLYSGIVEMQSESKGRQQKHMFP